MPGPRQNSGRPGLDFDYLRLCDGDKGKGQKQLGPGNAAGNFGNFAAKEE